jgi:peptidoglycan/xylan/chitin deacetylase (PgdA/CDA1 family)
MSSIPILLYHSVGEDCAPAYRRWLVKPEQFSAQLGALYDRGYRAITVGELAALRHKGWRVPPRTCVVTFDDGLRDFAKGAMPVLARHGFSATLYVVSGLVGATARWLTDLGEGERPMLDWPGLRDLHGAGVEIGAHSVRHLELDTLSHSRARQEIEDSKRTLEDGLGESVATFAYPHGYASRATRRIVQEAGYLAACRVRHALSDVTEDLFTLSRIVVTSGETPQRLIELIEGSQLPVAPAPDRLIAAGWRAARRLRALNRSVWTGGALGGG